MAEQTKRITSVMQELGKVPPQAIEAEEAVLAATMIDPQAIYEIPDLLPKHFYKENHQLIFSAIAEMEGKGVDLVTVTKKLQQNQELEQIGGPYFLSVLTNKVSSSHHIRYHADLIIEACKLRDCIRVGHEIQTAGFGEDLSLISIKLNEGHDILINKDKKDIQSNAEIGDDVVNKILEVNNSEGQISGIPTKFFILDQLIYGLNAPDLIIVAGRPGMGKTAFALAIAFQVAEQGHPVAFFSLEMSKNQLYMRELSFCSEIPMGKFKRSGAMSTDEQSELQKANEYTKKLPLFIEDTPGINIIDLKAKARRMATRQEVKMIVVDYIQLVHGNEGGNREQEIMSISRGLKELAIELNVPILALSQLSRLVEDRRDKKPMLRDLRESGAIEQDADIVIFPWRPEMYGITEIEDYGDSSGKVIVMVQKHRNGSLGDLIMGWNKSCMKFFELTEDRIMTEEHDQPLLFNNNDDESPF